ncbi:MAG: Mannosyltransferase [Verrucomicrobiales bacterium]|nr:Mannosyltransferase [Verrucomicrobiales bacterium]
MKILYDGFIFSAQESGGISRYFASLIKRLPGEWRPVLRCRRIPKTVSQVHARLQMQPFDFSRVKPEKLSFGLGRLYFKALDKAGGYDIAHPTYHFLLPNDRIKPRRSPLVITIHDMIPEIFASELDREGYDARGKRAAIEAASAIICVSHNTKRDLQARFNIPDSRITVTHLASEVTRDMAFGAEPVPAEPYFLFMGNRGFYKNFVRCLLGFHRVAETWKDLTMCIIGSHLNATEREVINSLNLGERVRHLGFVSDTHLAKLYRCSQALLYPSLYEGFGIPPLEAMACGTMVIASHRSSLPEVVGDAALIVNPESVEEISEALLSLRGLGSARETFIGKGYKQAAQFTWEQTARKTIDVYQSLAA